MNYEYVKNCKFCSESTDHIDCIVKFSHFDEELPFTASKNDTQTYGREIYARIMSGEFGDIAPFVPRVITQEEKEQNARYLRDQLLLEMDAVISNPLRWASFSVETQAAWTTYRQALIDVPQQAGFPDSVTWPIKPE